MAKQLKTDIVIGGKTSPTLNKAFETAQKKAETTSKVMNKIGGALKTAAKVTAATTLAIGIAVGGIGAKGLETASDLTEVQNVVDTTFKASSKQIDAWSEKALEAYGLSTLQAKQYTGTLGALMKSSGIASEKLVQMSTDLAGLAGDFASFYNLAQDDAFEKIRAGISGETEPLKALGINMSVANMEAFALSKGIKASWNSMDQAAQTQLRYLYLMQQSKDAQGDFNKTLETSYANQKRVATTRFNETLGKLATGLLPVATKALEKVNTALASFTSDPEKIEMISNAIGNVGTSIMNGVVAFIPYLKWIVFTGIPGTIGLLDRLLPLIAGVGAAFLAWKVVSTVQNVIGSIEKARLALTLFSMGQTSAAVQQAVLNGTFTAWETIVGLLTGKIKLATVAQKLWNLAMSLNPVGLIVAGIAALIAIFAVLWVKCEGFRNFWIGLWNGIVSGVKIAIDWIKSNWPLVIGFILNPFGAIFATLYKYNEGFRNWVNGVVQIIKSPINTLIGFINNSFIAGLNKLKIPDWVPKFGGKGINIPMIPMLAKGATVNNPTLAMIGEAGPETVVPHNNKPRSRALLAEAAAGVGVTGGGDIYVTFAPVIHGGNDIKQQISEAEDEFERRMDAYFARKRRFAYGL